jgi:hypothetical protein
MIFSRRTLLHGVNEDKWMNECIEILSGIPSVHLRRSDSVLSKSLSGSQTLIKTMGLRMGAELIAALT